MSKYSENDFNTWKNPPSDSEEDRIANTKKIISNAIKANANLSSKDIEIFEQGSYPNNTNIRLGSDLDICVMLKDTFYDKYRDGVTRDRYGFIEGTNNFDDYKKFVIAAMSDKFGTAAITIGNKSIKIHSKTTSSRVDADVVPAFQYRDYSQDYSFDAENFTEGIKFFSGTKEEIFNYPKLHIEKGREKNTDTYKRYKSIVRIFKKVKVEMENSNVIVSQSITSFLLECLIWNVPKGIFNDNESWTERFKQSLIFLYNQTKTTDACKEWGEVSEKFYLFHAGRKWSVSNVNAFLVNAWNFLEF